MSGFANLVRDRRGSAGAEMAFVAPMLLLLMFGSIELGRYFWNEHVLVKGVRDASVFVARQDINKFSCDTGAIDSGVVTTARNLVRTGQLSGGTDLLPHWTDTGAAINLTLTCVTSAGGTALGGIYTANANKVPVLSIAAEVPYNTVMKGYGLKGTLTLRANEQSAVMGI